MWNLTKFQLNQTTDRKNENNNCLNKLNKLKLCEVSRNFKQMPKVSAFYLEKQKSFIPKKKILSRTAKIDPKDGVSRLNFPEGFEDGLNTDENRVETTLTLDTTNKILEK